MAAAAYGTVVSLMHVLDNLQHPARKQLHYDRDQIKTLGEKVSFLLGFLEDYSEILCRTEIELDLARQIANAVDEVEEIIDYHVVDQLSQRSAYEVDKGLSSFREDMDKVLNKIESIKKELMMVKDDQKRPPQLSQRSTGSSAPHPSDKINTMVGFDEHLDRIMDQLVGHEPNLQIVPITGMGGIGKTTLAQNIFASRRVVDHFDLCKWITISQSYSIQHVLLSLLGGIDHNKNSEESNKNILAELGGDLHKMLFGKRYLIVMDDVWSTEIWDKLGLFCPNNSNGSRIIVTTRLSKVAASLGSHNDPYVMDFLDEEKSWILFCIKAFEKEICLNPELEKIGKSIVQCCKGLPLAIAVIGGLLGKSNMTREDWEFVAKDVMKSLDNSKEDEDCTNILSWSYKHLPIYLKSCFLYMRVFHEDQEINVEELIHYWIAEGFIKPKQGETLEEVAYEYLKDLIDRNLILIHQRNPYTGEVWECKVHDLLRDLCIKEYEKEQFFRISKVQKIKPGICFLCCYRKPSTWIHLPQVNSTTTLPKEPARYIVCNVCNIVYSQNNRLRLVNASDVTYDLTTYQRHTRSRYLDLKGFIRLKSTSLLLLWNLQYLHLGYLSDQLPFQIWEMPQLRLLDCPSFGYDPPVTQNDAGSKYYPSTDILENLQTLGSSEPFRGSDDQILKRIPNVKTLCFPYRKQHSHEFGPPIHTFYNLADLDKLEALASAGLNLERVSFPNSMKILYLTDCNCPWERMTVLGSLPNLEVLFLLDNSLVGPEWNPIEGEFLRLKTLSIKNNDLVRWNAEQYHFPKLEILELQKVKCLEKIPPGIGEIATLREVWLESVTESLIQSVEEMIEEQREYGNEDLQLILARRH